MGEILQIPKGRSFPSGIEKEGSSLSSPSFQQPTISNMNLSPFQVSSGKNPRFHKLLKPEDFYGANFAGDGGKSMLLPHGST